MITKRGVYTLVHIATKSIYVGSSINMPGRRKRWWSNMRANPQNLPPNIRALSCNRRDWAFSVLWDGTNATSEQLEAQERRAVELMAVKAPARLLNAIAVYRPDNVGFTAGERTMSLNAWSQITGTPRATISARIKYGWTPEECVGLVEHPPRDYHSVVDRDRAISMMATTIVADDGTFMLIGEAAAALGCRYDTLARRLANRRAGNGGLNPSVTLAELRALSQQYRRWTFSGG
jgi:hypothetical protein